MAKHDVATISPAQAAELLGVTLEASADEIRRAYLRAVAENPPDRSPERFELIRDAHRALSDGRLRHQHVLHGPDPSAPLVDLLQGVAPARAHVDPKPWLAVLRERPAASAGEARAPGSEAPSLDSSAAPPCDTRPR